MPACLLRDEIWTSDRFLDLPNDTTRLAFLRLLNIADDFGNFEGGSRRMCRIFNHCLQIKTEVHSVEIMILLMDCDLIRRYEFEGRELFHIPRYGQHRTYKVRKVHGSPWDENLVLGKENRHAKKNTQENQYIEKNLPVTSQVRNSDVTGMLHQEVEVEVEVEVETNTPLPPLKGGAVPSFLKIPDWLDSEAWENFVAFRKEKKSALSDHAKKLAFTKLAELREAGHDPVAVIEQSILNGWKGLFEVAERKTQGNGQWWASDAGIDAKGSEIGLKARGGENYSSYKARIFEKIRDGK